MKKSIILNEQISMPLLALRGIAVFPGMLLHFDVGRKKSIIAINEAMKENQHIFLVAQRDMRDEETNASNIFEIGTVAIVKQILHLPGETIKVLVEGLHRAKLIRILNEEPFFSAIVEEPAILAAAQNISAEALIRRAQEMITEFSEIGPKLPADLLTEIIAATDTGKLADFIASNIFMRLEDKQLVLEEFSPGKRLTTALKILDREISILDFEQEIGRKVHTQIDKGQREYYIREQIKVLSTELGENESPQDEAQAYHEKIESLKLNDEIAEKLHKEAERLAKMPNGSHEGTVVRTWLDTVLTLPWNKLSKDKIELINAKKVLDENHFGLEKVKERIIEMLAVKKLAPSINGQILCLVVLAKPL
jgi:ATP-dependent Lon protease